ncbi:unnamed protein product [Fusarium graminearum]|uniref:Uncharacterized protein n=1 Tax=Gibberella zeae TaxID=5518 RepID=A0A4U9ESZ1_GIBZA|nr:unnamed protein product [Fusarium graminearum]CAF3582365.1 unnamed protein product [Fusarium graminearum]CAG1961198.1 unnamed protein product [Fusarium graminearum]CAG1967625.1 unnamed protein product [Fusarium graminearum]CAG1972808.1 unnamed protein product [Fusarium graminearum]
MSIFYIITHDEQHSNLGRPKMSQSIVPYLLGTLVFLVYVVYTSIRTGAGLRHRTVEQFEFFEATIEEKIIYLGTQMRWWDYYCGLWYMHLVIHLCAACQTRGWPYTISVTYMIVCVAYFYVLSMILAMAEVQLPSLWSMLTDGRRAE